MDFRTGDTVIPAGAPLAPASLALALSAGHGTLDVHRLPSLAVIDSGDELADDPADCALHRIPASNGVMLSALAAPLCHGVTRTGPVADRADALLAAFESARDADVIVTSGGASVGDHDLIRPALETWGAQLAFWRVAIKPGKPLLIATRENAARRQIIVGLPGNPVSAFVTGYFFLLPLLRRLGGAKMATPRSIVTRLAGSTPATGSRREFVRGIWDGEAVQPIPLRDSGALTSLAHADALIDLPAGSPPRRQGDNARIYLIRNGGIA
ncbi:molybdopterin-binding protein [Novosphingobium sp. 9]|uniref:molybdopterin-binding protein n=1 Tax=Novosphingobium sp. 9 TaxID=2025349 RepID=UPI0028CB52B0|nr:molybdopterin-binding protein [Novosphingobium sp. 9]